MVLLRQFALLVFILPIASLLLSECNKSAPDKDALLSRANQEFSAYQYVKAEADYRSVLHLDPNNAVANRQMALLYYNQDEHLQAYSFLTRAAKLGPDNPDIRIKLGMTYLWDRQFKQAREAATAVLQKQPGNQDALLLLVATSRPLGDSAQMENTIASYRKNQPDGPGFHLALGQLARQQSDHAKAEREFKAALALDPKSSAAYLALANLYWSQKDLARAAQSFKSAADLSAWQSPDRIAYVNFEMQTGEVTKAQGALNEIVAQVPDALPPHILLMKIACEQKSPDCGERIKKILAQDPLNFDGLMASGLLSIAQRDGPQAVRTLAQMSRIYSGIAQVRYLLAAAYLLNGEGASVDKAIDSLTTALKLDPHLDQATLLLAQLRIRKAQYGLAVDLLNQLIKEQPNLAQARMLLASAYLGQQNQSQALAIYQQMTELFPKDPQPSFLAGMVLLGQHKLPEARKAIEKSLAIAPNYLPAVERLVDLDLVEKEYDPAIALIQKQIDKNPANAQSLAIRAKIYLAQRDFSHAESDLQKAIKLDPNLERAYLMLAELYVATNRQQQAIDKLDAFVAKNKDLPAFLVLAAIHDRLGQYEPAAEAYQKALLLNPNQFAALNNLAYLDAEHLGKLDAAYDLAKRAQTLAPDNPSSADTLGWVLFKKGEFDHALPLLQASAEKVSDNPTVEFHLGMAYYMKGAEEAARAAFQKAIANGKDFADKTATDQRLAILTIDVKTADSAVRAKLEDYIRQNPNDPVALVYLAQFEQRDGTVDQAIKTYQKALDTFPQFGPALRGLSLLYAQHSPTDPKTYAILEKARLAYPNDFALAKALGILNYRRGSYRRAAELLQIAAGKEQDDAELEYYLGMSHYQLNENNLTKDELERALLSLKLKPDDAAKATHALRQCCESAD